MQSEKQGVVDILHPILISLTHLYSMDRTWRERRGGDWTVPVASTIAESLSALSSVTVSPCLFVFSMTPYLSFHLSPSPSPLCLALSPPCSPLSARSHLSGRVIEPCVPSLSAKRLADCLHFHAEGCEAGVAVVRAIDWDPSEPSL